VNRIQGRNKALKRARRDAARTLFIHFLTRALCLTMALKQTMCHNMLRLLLPVLHTHDVLSGSVYYYCKSKDTSDLLDLISMLQ